MDLRNRNEKTWSKILQQLGNYKDVTFRIVLKIKKVLDCVLRTFWQGNSSRGWTSVFYYQSDSAVQPSDFLVFSLN